MPSLLEKHTSESVNLAASESSPYEPPQRTSQDKSWYYGARPIGSFTDGLQNGGLTSGQSDGPRTQISEAKVQNLQSLPNGRSSGSTDRLNKVSSKNNSNHSLPPGAGSAHEQASDVNAEACGVSKPSSMEKQAINVDGRVTQSTRSDLPAPVRRSQDGLGRRLGHARAHSSSAPQSPSSYVVHAGNAESGQQAVRNDAGLRAPRNENQSTSRFSSPPTLTQSSSTALNSSGAPVHLGAVRLQHRHTLQIPKIATGRTSRDFSGPHTSTSDHHPSSEVERLSPVHVGRGSTSLARRPTRSIHSDMYLDEIPQDDDMARWTETIRQKRASRRKRKDEEEDDRVVVGTKVDMNHVNWVTAYNMLTGIRFTVSRTNAKIDRDLTDGDFDARHKFSFDITGNELTPSAKYDFKFKDYAPWVFRHIRAHFMIDPADYLVSLTSKYILSELGSPGKSGSFFYFSRDYKYIIKTIHHAEHKLLRKILRDYYAHIDKYPNTLLSQFYGLHRVKIPYGRKIHFVVMNNLFPPHRDIHQTFDLKGSTIGRDFKEADLERNPRATLKDLNWLRRNYHFEFGPEKKQVFVDQLKRDVALLQRLKIMDYSLLVGIHDLSKGNEENLRDKTLRVFQPGGDSSEAQPNVLTRTPSKLENQRMARELRQIIKKEKPVLMEKSTSRMPDEMLEERKNFLFYSDDGGFQATHEDGEPGEEIYYLGVIDCLTHYGLVKRAEHLWKGMSNNKSQISPIPPEAYGDRFVKFIVGLTKTKEEVEREPRSTDQMDGSVHTDRQPSFTLSRHSTDKVIQKAEKQAQKTEKQGASEENLRDRTLTADRTGGAGGTTLPVVEEDGEKEAGGSREDSIRYQRSNDHFSSAEETNPISSGETQIHHRLSGGERQHLPSIPFFNRLSLGLQKPGDG